jgi:hypothetical protein
MSVFPGVDRSLVCAVCGSELFRTWRADAVYLLSAWYQVRRRTATPYSDRNWQPNYFIRGWNDSSGPGEQTFVTLRALCQSEEIRL